MEAAFATMTKVNMLIILGALSEKSTLTDCDSKKDIAEAIVRAINRLKKKAAAASDTTDNVKTNIQDKKSGTGASSSSGTGDGGKGYGATAIEKGQSLHKAMGGAASASSSGAGASN